jgi:pilus assembly protein CpaC
MSTTLKIFCGFRLAGTLMLAVALFAVPLVSAQQPAAAPASAAQQAQNVNSAPESSEPQTLHLLVGRSLVISSPTRIKRVSLADPDIAEAIVVSPTQVLVNGKKPGGVSLMLWDEADQSQAFELSVDIDVLGLSQKIHEVFPTENVHIDTSRDVVILTGNVSSSTVADKVLEVVKAAAPKVTNMMQIPAPPNGEILLQVRFAEVDRTLLNQFGINILSLPGAKNIGTITTQQFGAPQLQNNSGNNSGTGVSNTFNLSDLLNIFIFRPDINLAATIRALQEQNVLQILAEPNLMTSAGKEASFLAGGEFPYPVPQGGGTGFITITIQFKEFGVKLNFTPTFTPEGLIHLKVKPEVSSLDFTNALQFQGFTVPALSTRRMESEVDLADGQSFAIAGLMDNRVTEQLSKIPWIGDVPVLGELFRSKSLNRSKDELLVVVTPIIVKPGVGQPNLPSFPVPFLEGLPQEQGKTPGAK